MKTEQIENVIAAVEQSNVQHQIMISYLQELKKEMNKEEKGKIDLKILQIERDIKFNLGYVEHAKKL